MNCTFRVFALLLITFSISAQFDHKNVFKGMSGDDLYYNLRSEYKATTNLDYGEARDTLYKLIDILPGNKLECVYTGYQITLNLSADPTVDAFSKGINAEHSYPQSKGADSGLGNSDMHHLYPSRENVNSDRSSHPYGDAFDANTDFWYINDIKTKNIPTSNIDGYSELDHNNTQTVFEPRELVKGNIARGIFYFYTMYREEATAADPSFFGIQKETLCKWHFDDLVDEREWNRTYQIAKYQDGKVNPFVLDCSLASRLYCDQISDACEILTATNDLGFNDNIVVSNPFPNPTNQNVKIGIESKVDDKIWIRVFDALGNKTYMSEQIIYSNNILSLDIALPEQNGIYLITIGTSENEFITRKVIKL